MNASSSVLKSRAAWPTRTIRMLRMASPFFTVLQQVEPGDRLPDRRGLLVEPGVFLEREVERVRARDAQNARGVMLERRVGGQRQAGDRHRLLGIGHDQARRSSPPSNVDRADRRDSGRGRPGIRRGRAGRPALRPPGPPPGLSFDDADEVGRLQRSVHEIEGGHDMARRVGGADGDIGIEPVGEVDAFRAAAACPGWPRRRRRPRSPARSAAGARCRARARCRGRKAYARRGCRRSSSASGSAASAHSPSQMKRNPCRRRWSRGPAARPARA